jgi:hypothetical protein
MKRISRARMGQAMGLGNGALQERQRSLRIPSPDLHFLANSTKGPLTGTDWAITIGFFFFLGTLGTIASTMK